MTLPKDNRASAATPGVLVAAALLAVCLACAGWLLLRSHVVSALAVVSFGIGMAAGITRPPDP